MFVCQATDTQIFTYVLDFSYLPPDHAYEEVLSDLVKHDIKNSLKTLNDDKGMVNFDIGKKHGEKYE